MSNKRFSSHIAGSEKPSVFFSSETKRQRVEDGEDERKLRYSSPFKKRCTEHKVRFGALASEKEKMKSVRNFMLALRLTNKGVHESAKTEKAAEKRRERKRQINRQSALRKRIREKGTLGELQDKNQELLVQNKTLKKEQQEIADMIRQVKQAMASKSRNQTQVAAFHEAESHSPMAASSVATTSDLKTLQITSMQKQLEALQHSGMNPLSVNYAGAFRPQMMLPAQQRYVSPPPIPENRTQNDIRRSRIGQQVQMAIDTIAGERALEMLSSSERSMPLSTRLHDITRLFQTFEQQQPTQQQQLLSQLFTCMSQNKANNYSSDFIQLNALLPRQQQLPKAPRKMDAASQLIAAWLANIR